MLALNNYRIEWRSIHPSTFMYGTTLQFKKEGTLFKNSLMPSGTVIHDWHMLTRFDVDKTVPSLPILRRGYRYEIKLNFDVQPQRAAYVKVTFYRKNDSELSYLIIEKEDEMTEFKFPEEAYAYKIELINAGLNFLLFHNLTISEIGHHGQENDNVIDTDKIEIINKVIHQNNNTNGGISYGKSIE